MHRKFSLAVTALALGLGAAAPAGAELIYGLTTDNDILLFDSAAPTVVLDGGRVNGVIGTADLEAIDYRPATGEVYLIDDSAHVYTFDVSTFEATLVGTYSPRIPGTSFAFDFNPVLGGGEFARIITETNDNRVISGETGQYLLPVEKTDVFFAAGDRYEGMDPNIAGIAYTNSVAGATSTQQYGIDSNLGVLTTVANNAGTLQTVGSLGLLGGLSNELGFDISGASGIAYANFLVDGENSSGLWQINLSTGQASYAGRIGSGDVIRDLTVVPVPEPTATLALAGIAGLGLLRRRKA